MNRFLTTADKKLQHIILPLVKITPILRSYLFVFFLHDSPTKSQSNVPKLVNCVGYEALVPTGCDNQLRQHVVN